MDESRRRFLKSSLFGSTAILASQIPNINKLIADEDGEFIAPKKSTSHGLYAITFGQVNGSQDFPLRPGNAIASDGSLVWFVWPSDKGAARGYIKQYDSSPIESPDMIVHRLRMGKPEIPYYLIWRNADYYLYKTPGSLVKRATYLLHNKTDEGAILQALSDYRFAALLNAVFAEPEKAEQIINEITDTVNQMRVEIDSLNFEVYIERFKTILTKSRI